MQSATVILLSASYLCVALVFYANSVMEEADGGSRSSWPVVTSALWPASIAFVSVMMIKDMTFGARRL
jgi:hypothetical protein